MNKRLWTLALVIGIAAAAPAYARNMTLTTELSNYSGDGAYLAIYIADQAGAYQQTLWVAGRKSKYYRHLGGWARGSNLDSSEFDGRTGASVLNGRTLSTTVEIADNLIDAGYQILIDSSVEDKRDVRNDVSVPLTQANSAKAVSGRGYIKAFSFTL
ncbi:MAG: DUF2271 domain-containing protein [Reinekea forsetii]|nr:DUF2271 domain-containing protein [Reinekea forsetii]